MCNPNNPKLNFVIPLNRKYVVFLLRQQIRQQKQQHQQLILDRKLTPFEKAKKIAIAAYQYAQMEIPI